MNLDQLPTDIQDQFSRTGQKGEWTPEEAYEHLVPEHLRDHPDEIRSYMNGNPELGIADKDVSRKVSGYNGGEYSTENTIMENASTNRSYGAENMTPERYQEAVELNAHDAAVIEAHYAEDGVSVVEGAGLVEAGDSILETVMDGIIPVGAGIAAAAYVGGQFDKPEDRLGYGALAAGATTLAACTPPGQVVIGVYAGFKLVQTGFKVVGWLLTP